MEQIPATPPKQREPQTLWKMVEAKCSQISDSTTTVRLSLFLALTWSFLWLAALYVSELGYTQVYRQRVARLSALAYNPDGFPSNPEFKQFCWKVLFDEKKEYEIGAARYAYHPGWKIEHCRKVIGIHYEFATKAFLESQLVALPWGMGRMHISDFGVIGNAALILILGWSYFAMRRENHAITSLVAFSALTVTKCFGCPRVRVLLPMNDSLSAEHYAYSYHVVSQRFMFLSSGHSSWLLGVTVAFGIAPTIAPVLNLLSDSLSLASEWRYFETSVYVRVILEVPMVAVVLFTTGKVVQTMLNSSALLNSWSLAARDVWMRDWDERTDDPACAVLIDVAKQSAERMEGAYPPVEQQNAMSHA